MRAVRRSLLCLLAGSAVALAACAPDKPKFRATDVTGVAWGGDFELTAHGGVKRRLSDYRGKVVLLFFGYSNCPDICGPTLAKLAAVVNRLGERAADLQVVFVGVDAARDSPAELAKFLRQFHPSFTGFSGSAAEIAAVTADYKIAVSGQKGAGAGAATLTHSGVMMAKDRQDRLRLIFQNDASIDDLVHDVGLLLAEAA